MANTTDIRLSFVADSSDLNKIAALFRLGGDQETPDAVSLTGRNPEDDDLLKDPSIEMMVDGILVITGTHDWGVPGYVFSGLINWIKREVPSLKSIQLRGFDPLIEYWEVLVWDHKDPSHYQSRILEEPYVRGILFATHECGGPFAETEFELQRDLLQKAYTLASENGFIGIEVDRSLLYGP